MTLCTAPGKGDDLSDFLPPFSSHSVTVLDYEGDDWSMSARKGLERYVWLGGGLVIYHASNNAFPSWREFQALCGIGGWAGRDEASGPKVRWRDGRMVLDSSGGTAMHPPRHDFAVVTRAVEHPIMAGLPLSWLQPQDEIYSQLRGPAQGLDVLATASADPAWHSKATGEHEPMLMTIRYGHGRVFHTTLGHVGPSDVEPLVTVENAGFVATFRRGTEWAATGEVTQSSS